MTRAKGELNESRCTQQNIREKVYKSEGKRSASCCVLFSFLERLLSVVYSDLAEARSRAGAGAVGPGPLDGQPRAQTGSAVPTPPRAPLGPGYPRPLHRGCPEGSEPPFPAGGGPAGPRPGPRSSFPRGESALGAGGPGRWRGCRRGWLRVFSPSRRARPGAVSPLPAPGTGQRRGWRWHGDGDGARDGTRAGAGWGQRWG